MKSSHSVLLGIVIGLILGLAVYHFMIDTSESNEPITETLHEEESNDPGAAFQSSEREEQPKGLVINSNQMRTSRGISIGHADTLFQDYHRTRTPSLSSGIMNIRVDDQWEKVTHFYLNYQNVIKPLSDKILAATDSTLKGFAGLLAFNDSLKSHTMMWVAVVEAADGKDYYFLPKNYDHNEKSYVYDYVGICPKMCPENEDRIWDSLWVK